MEVPEPETFGHGDDVWWFQGPGLDQRFAAEDASPLDSAWVATYFTNNPDVIHRKSTEADQPYDLVGAAAPGQW